MKYRQWKKNYKKTVWGKPASKHRQEKTEKGSSKDNKSPC